MAHRVHLDYASSAPLRPQVIDSLKEISTSEMYDPRRLYDDAAQTRYAIEDNREKVASFFGADASEIIFTSSHSESLAMFAYGVVSPTHRDSGKKIHMIGTPYDSDVIYQSWLKDPVALSLLSGNTKSTLDLSHLGEIAVNASAITVPWAHPDTGALQDIDQIAEIVRTVNPDCLIHIDARLACGNVAIDFSSMNIDALSIDGSTFGGPFGVAALIVAQGKRLVPMIDGATQERARRGGLENVIGIAAFGTLCESVASTLQNEIDQSRSIQIRIDNAIDASSALALPTQSRLPNITAARFEGVAASAVVAEFNRAGINIHAGSSCGSEEFEPSRALAPVTGNDSLSETVFRISFGWATSENDIDAFCAVLNDMIF
jgi:cysteine desulfurase